MDVSQPQPEIDLVELIFEHIRRIAVAVPTGGTFIRVAHQRFGFRQVKVLSSELVDERVAQTMVRQAVLSQAAKPKITPADLAWAEIPTTRDMSGRQVAVHPDIVEK